MTFDEYCDNPALVKSDALASGLRGKPYLHYFTTKGRYNGKTETRYAELDNLDLYEYAKRKYKIA